MLALMVFLIAFILCCFSSLKSLLQDSRYLLNRSSIQTSSIKISRSLSILLDRWPDPSNQILCGLCPLNSFSIPSSIYREFLPLTPSQYLSIYRAFVLNKSSIPPQSIELRFLYILWGPTRFWNFSNISIFLFSLLT